MAGSGGQCSARSFLPAPTFNVPTVPRCCTKSNWVANGDARSFMRRRRVSARRINSQVIPAPIVVVQYVPRISSLRVRASACLPVQRPN